MDFNQVIQEYNRLHSLYQSRQLSEQAFKAAIDQLTATDAYGRFWHWEPLSNQWFRFENGQWLRDTPPIQPPAYPPQPPAHPQQPVYPPSTAPLAYPPPAARGYAPVSAPPSNKGLWIGLSAVLGLVVIALVVMFATGVFSPKTAATATIQPQVSVTAPVISSATPLKALEPTASKAPTLPPATPTLVPPAATPTLVKPTNKPTTGLNPYLDPATNYLLYSTDSAIVLVKPDLTTVQLNQQDIMAPDGLQVAVSPKGGLVAFVTTSDSALMNGLTLHVVRLSDVKEIFTLPLTNPQTETNATTNPGDPADQAAFAMVYQNLSWSDDGKWLAFSAAIDGTSADAYLLDLTALKVKRLSSEAAHAFSVKIAPDGKNIVFFAASSFGTGAGFSMAGVWVVPASGGSPTEIYKPTTTEVFVGWSGPTTFVVQSFNAMCGDHNLRQINFSNKTSTSFINSCISSSALDSKTGAVMAATNKDQMSFCTCGQKLDVGLYYASVSVPAKLVDKGDYYDVFWASGPGFFTGVRADKKLTGFTDKGNPRALPANLPSSTPKGNILYAAWAGNAEVGSPGLTLTMGGGSEGIKVFNDHVQDLAFNAEFSALFFLSNQKLYVSALPNFAAKSLMNTPGAAQLAFVAK